MKVVVKPAFLRDIGKLRNKKLQIALDKKITQIEKARTISQITGLKLLRGYRVHFRIKVETSEHKYRIGSTIRRKTVWLVRFLARKKIYREFP